MIELLNAVAGALIAAGILAVAARISLRNKWVLASIVGRLLGVHFIRTFPNKAAAQHDVKAAVAASPHSVRLLTSRGDDLGRDTFESLLRLRGNRTTNFRILLPLPTSQWTVARNAELAAFDPNFKDGTLARSIADNVATVNTFVPSGLVSVGFYDFPHIARIVLTDHVAFLTPYHAREHGRDNPVIECAVGSPLYDFLERIFALFDTDSVPPGHPR